MNIKITIQNITLFTFILFIFLSVPQSTFAIKVDHGTVRFQHLGPRRVIEVSAKVESQDFNMVRSDNNNNLQSRAKIPQGTILTYRSNSPASGTWQVAGGYNDTPDMNGRTYNLSAALSSMYFERPPNNGPSSIRGGGAVSCNGNICSATGTGDASITIEFPSGSVPYRIQYTDGVGAGGGISSSMNYLKASYTYEFKVEPSSPRGSGRTPKDIPPPSRSPRSGRLTPTDIPRPPTPDSRPTPREPNTRVTCIAPFNETDTSFEARWSYSDPDPGDRQTNAVIEVSTNPNFNGLAVPPITANGAGSTRTVTGLSPGTTYYVRVKVRNASDGWTNFNTCPNGFATLAPNYPEPIVDFTIRKEGNSPANPLTVDQGDRVKVEWKVTNEAGLTGCTVSTSGPDNLFSGNDFWGEQTKEPLPKPDDTTYTVTLQCTGKTPAQINRGFTQTRTLTVLSYPVLSSCTIGDNRRSVSASNPSIDINLRVENTNDYYNWAVRRGVGNDSFGPNTRKNNPGSLDPLELKNISYTGTAFGRYTPSVRVTNKYGRSRTISCPSIANLGDSNVREVR